LAGEDVVTGLALESVFAEVAALLVLAAAVGFVGLLLRQPLIVSFIAVGLLAGPQALGIARSLEEIELLAELGVAVLLFLVGLKLDLHLVRTLGIVALTTGLGQVVFTSVFGFLIALALGLTPVASLYVAVALTFSSTIIIVKLLSDKREIDALHGRIALGFLIVQDLVVVIAMVVLSAFGVGAAADAPLSDVLMVFVWGAVLLGLIGLFIRYVAEPLLARLTRAPELLLTFAIGWAAVLAALGDVLGFGKELGGLLAGVSLATTPYREAIASRLSSLRDFLLLFFFIALGVRLDLGIIDQQIVPALVFSAFVLIGNPLIVLVIMGVMGYRKRTGFLAGLTVAQISEFSLIFMAMGFALGHVDEAAVALVTLVGLITIATSTYMITYSQRLYAFCEPLLWPFERRVAHREEEGAASIAKGRRYDVLLFGLGRYGDSIAQRLRPQGLAVLGVDFDPEAVRRWQRHGHDAIYGDALDPDFPAHLPIEHARWVIVAVPFHKGGVTHVDPRLALAASLRQNGFEGRVVAAAYDRAELEALEGKGVDLVLLPFVDAADRAALLILGKERREVVPEETEVVPAVPEELPAPAGSQALPR
jgi:Kef-type K+ transport system membrane component KefB/Trk K+ transport system NAD-binding subunit